MHLPPGLVQENFSKTKNKTAEKNRGQCLPFKSKVTCKNWAHLEAKQKTGLKSHLRGSSTQPFNSVKQTLPVLYLMDCAHLHEQQWFKTSRIFRFYILLALKWYIGFHNFVKCSTFTSDFAEGTLFCWQWPNAINTRKRPLKCPWNTFREVQYIWISPKFSCRKGWCAINDFTVKAWISRWKSLFWFSKILERETWFHVGRHRLWWPFYIVKR